MSQVLKTKKREFATLPAAPANDMFSEVIVGGLRTACVTREQLANLMRLDCGAAKASGLMPKLIFASNGHAIATAALSPKFKALLETADMIHADGQPVVLASKYLARLPIPERSATTDFIHDAAATARDYALKIFLLGASEDVNARCADILRLNYPGLQISGRRNGYFSRGQEAEICEEINRSGADIVFVGLGVPLEYEFCVRNKHNLRTGWVVTCGGCYNFVAGDYKRAPEWMQRFSLEWLHRLVCEPKRLFWRYAVTNPIALFLLLTRTA